MAKENIINKITEHSADLIWEIDQSMYYQTIGWNGGLKNDSYWLKYILENQTNVFLKGLLKILQSVKN